MELLKKIWKELSVFALVLVIFVGLWMYRKITVTEYKTISWSSLESKIEKDDSFVVFFGGKNDQELSSYEEVITTYMDKKNVTIYYANLDKLDDASTYLKEHFDIDKQGIWTLGIIDGEIQLKESGALNYYHLSKWMDRYQEMKK